ncbi:Oligopeptide transporter, OPT superfamily [Dillenia turbinata]|uniref:Oligopeptide transporter, OPT superfamily n=1 Tax=Dillenia turbinata TaxID=194707 RepID=A0AAN8ZLE4_9MAGN
MAEDFVDQEDLSPIEQIRLTVTNIDDPTLAVWTFRMWFLGLYSSALLSFLNQFFSYRTEPLVITQVIVQVDSLPIGRLLATAFYEREISFGPVSAIVAGIWVSRAAEEVRC